MEGERKREREEGRNEKEGRVGGRKECDTDS